MNCPNGPSNAKVYRECKQGKWGEINSNECAFASSLTKQLLMLISNQKRSTVNHEKFTL